jgi:hypothetical protein
VRLCIRHTFDGRDTRRCNAASKRMTQDTKSPTYGRSPCHETSTPPAHPSAVRGWSADLDRDRRWLAGATVYSVAVNRIDRRKRETTDRILQAAFDLFLVQGVAATTIEEICDRADVANRTFFNHFPTRQAMVAALAQRRLTDVQRRLPPNHQRDDGHCRARDPPWIRIS